MELSSLIPRTRSYSILVAGGRGYRPPPLSPEGDLPPRQQIDVPANDICSNHPNLSEDKDQPMQITPAIHALRHPFKIPVAPGIAIDRFVYSYLLAGETITLIDTGVAGCENVIFDYIRSIGRDPREISLIILTHSHPDHIGAAKAIQRGNRLQCDGTSGRAGVDRGCGSPEPGTPGARVFNPGRRFRPAGSRDCGWRCDRY